MNSAILLFGQKIDINVLNYISNHTNALGVKLAIFVSDIGSPLSFLLITICMCLMFWLYKKPYHLIQFLITLATGSLVIYLMKILIARPRPAEALIEVSGYSFPSGHATIATLFCFLIVFAYKNHIKKRLLKFIFVVFFIISALAISFSRIYLSVHYASDVIVGIFIGLLISSISVFIFENFFGSENLV